MSAHYELHVKCDAPGCAAEECFPLNLTGPNASESAYAAGWTCDGPHGWHCPGHAPVDDLLT